MTHRRRAGLARALATLTLAISANAHAAPPPPDVAARAWILVEPQTGAVLAAHDPDRRLPPASLTKLMTAYLLFGELRDGRLALDEMATVSERAAAQPGARMILRAGERVRVEDLFRGMLVQSGNDATLTLIEHVSPDPRRFVDRMNAAAAALQLTATHFTNVSGLQNSAHFSSARDLTRLAITLRHEFPQYLGWFALRDYRHAGVRQRNRNPLLGMPGVDGLKTGHTGAAGYCLVASAARADLQLIATVLGTEDDAARARAGRTLLEYGFDNFQTRRVHRAAEPLVRARVFEGARDDIAVGLDRDLLLTLPRDGFAGVRSTAIVAHHLRAPLARGAVLGELRVSNGTSALASVPLVALDTVPTGSLARRGLDRLRLWFEGETAAQAAPP